MPELLTKAIHWWREEGWGHGCLGWFFTVWACVSFGRFTAVGLKGTAAAAVAASQQQQGEEMGGNGSLNSALKQEATPVLSLLCFYRLNFLPAWPPLLPRLRSLVLIEEIIKISHWADKSSLTKVWLLTKKFVASMMVKVCCCASSVQNSRLVIWLISWKSLSHSVDKYSYRTILSTLSPKCASSQSLIKSRAAFKMSFKALPAWRQQLS